MKREFLQRGSPDCPLIRLYEFSRSEAHYWRRVALQLARGKDQTVFHNEQPGVIPIGECKLTLSAGREGSRSCRAWFVEVQMDSFQDGLASGCGPDSALFTGRYQRLAMAVGNWKGEKYFFPVTASGDAVRFRGG
jgi:hypothetical protein